uniref:Uncharacterized protein n=1 Tax=Anguilla anguilla TaxID=7936 RepID=A0A0E9W4G6_ANGAN
MWSMQQSGRRSTHPSASWDKSPEGCSSYTFPKMMGAAKASEMLLFNKKLTAAEACERGLVTEVFPDSSFQTEVWTRLKAYAQLPPNSLALSKQLIRMVEKDDSMRSTTRRWSGWWSAGCLTSA